MLLKNKSRAGHWHCHCRSQTYGIKVLEFSEADSVGTMLRPRQSLWAPGKGEYNYRDTVI